MTPSTKDQERLNDPLLTEKEQAALDLCIKHMDLVTPHRKYADEARTNPMRGKCYPASVALLVFLGGEAAGYHLKKGGEDTNNTEHWWVENDAGVRLDPTKAQFDALGIEPPYDSGQRVDYSPQLTRHLKLFAAMRAETLADEDNGSSPEVTEDEQSDPDPQPPAGEGHNRLADLTFKLQREEIRIDHGEREAVEAGIQFGRLLLEVFAILPYGQQEAYVKSHFKCHYNTAINRTLLAQAFDKGLVSFTTIVKLGLTKSYDQARKQLKLPKNTNRSQNPNPEPGPGPAPEPGSGPAPGPNPDPKPKPTPDQDVLLASAWRALISEWAARSDELLRSYCPKGLLAIQFVRAMIYGEDIPRTATLGYVPQRFYVAGSQHSISEMMERVATNDAIDSNLRFICGENKPSFDRLLKNTLPVLGFRLPGDFPASLARDLIDTHCPEGGKVLDPCHGWGGRLLGFMLSKASSYTGIDPAPGIADGLNEMFSDLKQYLVDPKQVDLITQPFENWDVMEASYDFAFTSPPYFNIEKYHGDDSSWRRYPQLSEWIEGFYRAMIERVANALKIGGHFALQVTPKLLIEGEDIFDMVEYARRVGDEVRLKYEKTDYTPMRRYRSDKTEQKEVVAIFQRQ